jgi:hypothetical protein
MRLLFPVLFISIFCTHACGQAFEGVLKIDYLDEAGRKNAVDVYVKKDKFFIKKIFGGCDRYDYYIYDTRLHALWCMSPQNPQTALRLNIDQILDIYEKKQLKPNYEIHATQLYTPTNNTKKIGGFKATQKKADEANAAYEIWVADMDIDYTSLIPVLRVMGFWNMTEDNGNTILESQAINKKTKAKSNIDVMPAQGKVDDDMFKIPASFQQVDMDKFLVNESKSPRFGDLVKAFAGF